MVEGDIQIVEIDASFKFSFITEKAKSGRAWIYLELKIFVFPMVGMWNVMAQEFLILKWWFF